MRHIPFLPFLSHGKGLAPALFFMLCLFTLVFSSIAAAAGPGGKPGPGFGPGPGQATGGYTGPGPALVSVQQALSMPHETPVTVKGNITQYLRKDDYTFTDSTGSAEVKISPRAWMGQYVAASDLVELQGEVKKDHSRTRIHVHRVVTKQ